MNEWHVKASTAERYVDGTLAEPDCWSVEQHVEGCAPCAGLVSRAVGAGPAGVLLGDVRTSLLARVQGEAVTPAQARLPTRLWWAVGPALRGAWALALVVVAAGAVGLAHGADFAGARSLLLALAPVIPVAGVAVSYGRHTDPLHEIAASTPRGGLRLLLVRTVAVLAVSLPVLAVAGLLLPGTSVTAPGPATWLLPGLALTLAALALGGYVGCRAAAALVGGGWLLAVALPCLGESASAQSLAARLGEQLSLYLDGPTAQTSWAAALVLCAAVVAVRRNVYDRWETM
jgi:hypothetical protein